MKLNLFTKQTVRMIPLDYELSRIREEVTEMFDLVREQIIESKKSLLETDIDAAESVLRREMRVNALEINIDRDCENFLACYSPLAADLRYIISILLISESLERISDHGYSISKYVIDYQVEKDTQLFNELEIESLFDCVINMLNDTLQSLENKDSELAKKVFKQDKVINKAKNKSVDIIKKTVKHDIDKIKNSLYLFSIIGKLERCGDVIKNIAEEIVFYLEAEVLKHQKRNRKIQKRFEGKGNN